jgi:hypothetical protein
MLVKDLLAQLQSQPDTVDFSDVIACIDENYIYTPASFSNGAADNAAGTNVGSCKIFAFAQLNDLSVDHTLALFGSYYRDDVLKHPDADDHANIRNFMHTQWSGIAFASSALEAK